MSYEAELRRTGVSRRSELAVGVHRVRETPRPPIDEPVFTSLTNSLPLEETGLTTLAMCGFLSLL